MRGFNYGNQDMVVKTLAGLEDMLAQELTDLGATEVKPAVRAVLCKGGLETLFKINFQTRLAIRVLIPIERFFAQDAQKLYSECKKINWQNYMRKDQTFAIDAAVSSKYFNHSKFAALKVKDALVDSFRERYGMRPSVDTERPDVQFSLHIDQDRIQILMDSSGESLHRRGYRPDGAMAPLSEVLAAAMLKIAWDEKTNLLNPMCGSGTIALEAAMMNARVPAQFKRTYFPFLKWENFDRELWNKVKTEAIGQIRENTVDVFASDIDPDAVATAMQNLASTGLKLKIHFEQRDFFRYGNVRNHTVIINPPYGERLISEDIGGLYNEMANHLKHAFPGCSAWVISSNLAALKRFGLKPSRKITLFNGPLECRYLKFDLYEGSKKINPKHET